MLKSRPYRRTQRVLGISRHGATKRRSRMSAERYMTWPRGPNWLLLRASRLPSPALSLLSGRATMCVWPPLAQVFCSPGLGGEGLAWPGMTCTTSLAKDAAERAKSDTSFRPLRPSNLRRLTQNVPPHTAGCAAQVRAGFPASRWSSETRPRTSSRTSRRSPEA